LIPADDAFEHEKRWSVDKKERRPSRAATR
jgi:hypothetical protein